MTTKDQQRLTHWLPGMVRKLFTASASHDYDDLASIGFEGALKSEQTWDQSRSSFQTWARVNAFWQIQRTVSALPEQTVPLVEMETDQHEDDLHSYLRLCSPVERQLLCLYLAGYTLGEIKRLGIPNPQYRMAIIRKRFQSLRASGKLAL